MTFARKIRKRNAFVSFHVIEDDPQVIIIDINGVDKGVDKFVENFVKKWKKMENYSYFCAD